MIEQCMSDLKLLNEKLSSELKAARARMGYSFEVAAEHLGIGTDDALNLEFRPILSPLNLLVRALKLYEISEEIIWLLQTFPISIRGNRRN
jgi:hypothetical protein